jgi:hypothetical protein
LPKEYFSNLSVVHLLVGFGYRDVLMRITP